MRSWRCRPGAPPGLLGPLTVRECDTEVKGARIHFPNASILDVGSRQPSQERQTLLPVPGHSLSSSAQGWDLPSSGAARERPGQGLRRGGSTWMHRSVPFGDLNPTGETGSLPWTSPVSPESCWPRGNSQDLKAPSSDGEHGRHGTFLPARVHDPSFW